MVAETDRKKEATRERTQQFTPLDMCGESGQPSVTVTNPKLRSGSFGVLAATLPALTFRQKSVKTRTEILPIVIHIQCSLQYAVPFDATELIRVVVLDCTSHSMGPPKCRRLSTDSAEPPREGAGDTYLGVTRHATGVRPFGGGGPLYSRLHIESESTSPH